MVWGKDRYRLNSIGEESSEVVFETNCIESDRKDIIKIISD